MTNQDALLGFLVGAVVGAAAALLFAPQSGEQSRNRLREAGLDAHQKAIDAGQRVKDAVLDAKCGVEQSLSGAVAKVTANADRVVTAAERGRDAFKASLAAQA